MVFEMVKDIKVVFGKGPGSRSVPSKDGRAPMWKKKSIFWDLPYWKVLQVCDAIDVMHLTKNLCVNLLGFLGVYCVGVLPAAHRGGIPKVVSLGEETPRSGTRRCKDHKI
jgi:hypothetical protein